MSDRSKLRDAREWGTLIISFLTLIAIPIGLIVLRNQRLEIEQEMATRYVQRLNYSEDLNRAEIERREQRTSIGAIQGKIDNILMEQVRMSDNIAVLKERGSDRKP